MRVPAIRVRSARRRRSFPPEARPRQLCSDRNAPAPHCMRRAHRDTNHREESMVHLSHWSFSKMVDRHFWRSNSCLQCCWAVTSRSSSQSTRLNTATTRPSIDARLQWLQHQSFARLIRQLSHWCSSQHSHWHIIGLEKSRVEGSCVLKTFFDAVSSSKRKLNQELEQHTEKTRDEEKRFVNLRMITTMKKEDLCTTYSDWCFGSDDASGFDGSGCKHYQH